MVVVCPTFVQKEVVGGGVTTSFSKEIVGDEVRTSFLFVWNLVTMIACSRQDTGRKLTVDPDHIFW